MAYFRCGNAEIKHHFCGVRIFVPFLRNADISAKLISVAKKIADLMLIPSKYCVPFT